MSPAWVRCCVASFFHPCVWKPPAVQGRHSCRPRACVVVVWRYASRRSGDGRHKWRPYGVCHRAVVVARRFFIRACGNCHQRRGDIHVARVRAPLRPAVFSSVRVETAGSAGATFMSPAWVRCCTACASGMSGPWRLCRPRGRRCVSSVFASPLLCRAS